MFVNDIIFHVSYCLQSRDSADRSENEELTVLRKKVRELEKALKQSEKKNERLQVCLLDRIEQISGNIVHVCYNHCFHSVICMFVDCNILSCTHITFFRWNL